MRRSITLCRLHVAPLPRNGGERSGLAVRREQLRAAALTAARAEHDDASTSRDETRARRSAAERAVAAAVDEVTQVQDEVTQAQADLDALSGP